MRACLGSVIISKEEPPSWHSWMWNYKRWLDTRRPRANGCGGCWVSRFLALWASWCLCVWGAGLWSRWALQESTEREFLGCLWSDLEPSGRPLVSLGALRSRARISFEVLVLTQIRVEAYTFDSVSPFARPDEVQKGARTIEQHWKAGLSVHFSSPLGELPNHVIRGFSTMNNTVWLQLLMFCHGKIVRSIKKQEAWGFEEAL